ncbi:MAG: hypothetical protein ACP5NK_03440 [Thermoplasmata archaeon]
MGSYHLTELESTEDSLIDAIRSGKQRISIVGERFTGKTFLANALTGRSEFTDFNIIDCQYETNGKFEAEVLSRAVHDLSVSRRVIFFIQDYFLPRKREKQNRNNTEFDKIRNAINDSSVIRHVVSRKEARNIADDSLNHMLGIFNLSPEESRRISLTVDAIVEDARFGKSYIPGIVMEGVQYIKSDQKLRDILSKDLNDPSNNSEFHLRLREMEAEFRRRKEKTDFMLGIFGIEASAMLSAADGIVDSVKSAISGIVTPLVSTLLGCGLIGIVAVSTALLIKSSHKESGFMITFTKSRMAWKEMTDIKKRLIAYRIEVANDLPPMSAYAIIDEVFSGDVYREKLLREVNSLREQDRLLLEQQMDNAVSGIMKHIDQIEEMVNTHERKITAIEDDLRNLKVEFERIKSSYCLPPSVTQEEKIRSVFYPSVQAERAVDFASKGENLLITGISGSGKSFTASYVAMFLRDNGYVRSICVNSDISLNYGMAVFLENTAVVIDDVFGENSLMVSHADQLQRLLKVVSKRNRIILTSQSHVLSALKWLYPMFYDFLSESFKIIEIDPEEFAVDYWRGLYENYLSVFSTGIRDEVVDAARSLEPQVVSQFRMPISYDTFFNNFFKTTSFDNAHIQNVIQDAQNLRRSMSMRYIALEKEDRDFVKFVCMFPNLGVKEFITAYSRFYGKDLSGEDVESLRTRNEIFLRDTYNLNIVHSECTEGIWDKIAGNVDDLKNILQPVMRMFEFFDTRLQSISCIIQIIRRYSSLGSERIVSDFILHYINAPNAHKKHLAVYLISEILFSISQKNFMKNILSSLYQTEDGMFEAGFLLKALSRNEKWSKYAFDEAAVILANPVLDKRFISALKAQFFYSADLLRNTLEFHHDANFDEGYLIRSVEPETDIDYCLRSENNLLSGAGEWHYIGLKSGKFEKIVSGSTEWIQYIEEREDNLGRLFLDLGELVSSKKLVEGREYVLEAVIRTENIRSNEVQNKFGATVGIAYADDACWTPRRDAFQIEIGFVQGDTAETLYRGRFRLGIMPPGCTHLILYLVNVVGTGECWFKDIVLRDA